MRGAILFHSLRLYACQYGLLFVPGSPAPCGCSVYNEGANPVEMEKYEITVGCLLSKLTLPSREVLR